MAVGPTQPGHTPALRLVQPDQPLRPAQRAAPAPTPVQTPVRRTETDSFDIQSVQGSAQPSTSLSEARRKLEAIRDKLVAARAERPMHFDEPPAQPKVNNPAARQYLKIQSAVTPTDRNTNATEATVQRPNE